MRKIIPVVTFLLSFIAFTSSNGQEFSDIDTMSILTANGYPSDTIAIEINLVNTFDVAGFELRMAYDSAAFEPISASTAERSSSLETFGANFSEPGIIGFYATSFHPRTNAIHPGSGPIATIRLYIRNDALPGYYDLDFNEIDQNSYHNSLADVNSMLVIPVLTNGGVNVDASSGITDLPDTPRRIEFCYNYPNPFNSETSIILSLERGGEIKLDLYDVLGKRISTIYSGFAETGTNWFHWDGKSDSGHDVSSGVYFYRLSASWGESVTKTMTLLK